MRTVRSQKQTSGSPTPEIIVYPHRGRTMVWLLIGGVSSLLFFLFFGSLLLLIVFVPASRNGGAMFLAFLVAGAGIAALWPTRTVACLLSSGEPMLVITHQGLRVGKLYGPSEIVLP